MIETARQVVASGGLGAIGQAQVEFRLHHDFRGTFRETMEHPLILDMAVHHFDLIRYVTGLEPRSVAAHTWNPPWSQFAGDASAVCLFTMDGGARVVYTASWHPRGQVTDWNCVWLLECERGYLVLDRDVVTRLGGRRRPPAGPPGEEESSRSSRSPRRDQAAVLTDFRRRARRRARAHHRARQPAQRRDGAGARSRPPPSYVRPAPLPLTR